MNRRNFLKSSSLIALGSTLPEFLARTAYAAEPGKDNVLVVLEDHHVGWSHRAHEKTRTRDARNPTARTRNVEWGYSGSWAADGWPVGA